MDLPALVFLIGAAGAGKSTWAGERFLPEEIVSSDALRAVVGSGEGDLEASADAFGVLRTIVRARLGRRLTTVVDTTGLDADLRADCLAWAAAADMPAVAVVFDTPLELCKSRSRARARQVPGGVIASQHKRAKQVTLEGFDRVELVTTDAAGVRIETPPDPAPAPSPVGMRFVLHVARFEAPLGERLVEIARAAEGVGFVGISVMDHLVQIPQVGRPWEDIPEPFSALSFLAGVTERLELGALVVNVTLRNLGLLAKTVSTLDALSGGRAICGIGAGWNVAEERAYGYPPTDPSRRLDVLEDAARLLPLMWGKGSADFAGRTIDVVDAVTYPRPVRVRIPLLIGGGGERRTLRIAAAHADAVNLMGTPEVIAHKRRVLDAHCADLGRDPAEIETTVLDITMVGEDRRQVADLVEVHRGRTAASSYAARLNAGTVEAQVERYRRLSEMGIGTVFVGLRDLISGEQVERFGAVIAGLGGVASAS
jgi:alkanesulfonate monooxygenase SsuD/methylene tetrahydromethanopterin reductase-like flavin-dependent oxidoreductase (luciferase family)/predicted kinase